MKKINTNQASIIPLLFIIIGTIFATYFFYRGKLDLLDLSFLISFIIVIGAVIYSVIWAFLLKKNLLEYKKSHKSKVTPILFTIVALFISISFLIWGITTAFNPDKSISHEKPIIKIILFGGLLFIYLIYYLIQKLIRK